MIEISLPGHTKADRQEVAERGCPALLWRLFLAGLLWISLFCTKRRK